MRTRSSIVLNGARRGLLGHLWGYESGSAGFGSGAAREVTRGFAWFIPLNLFF